MLLHVWQFLLYCGETAMKLHYTALKRGIWNAFETDQNEFYKVFIYFVPFSWLLSQPSSFERIRERDYGRRVVILWDRLVIHNERPRFVLLKMCLDNLQIPPLFSMGPALEHCPSLAIWFLWNYGYGPASAFCSWCLDVVSCFSSCVLDGLSNPVCASYYLMWWIFMKFQLFLYWETSVFHYLTDASGA